MNKEAPTIAELLTFLHAQGMSKENSDKIEESLTKTQQEIKDPLYIRILYGIGAWFSTLFLMPFFGIFIMESSSRAMICGIAVLCLAVVIGKKKYTTFIQQLSLALALTGNFLVLLGVSDSFWESYSVVVIVITHAVVCIVMYPIYSNSIYRFLAPIVLGVLVVTWIFSEEKFALIHVLIAAEMLLAGALFLSKKCPPLLTPLAYSVAVLLPGTLLFINAMQMSGWENDFFTPLWSSITLAGGLIYLYLHLAGGLEKLQERWMMLAIGSTIFLGIFTNPGILVAIAFLVAGYALDNRILTALSYVFLPCFLIFLYYALHIDLAHKSWIIAGSGVLLLIVRWIVGYCQHEGITA